MRTPALLLGFALAATTLQAESFGFGLQFTAASPQGDLGKVFNGTTGYGFGLHALTDVGAGQAVMPRFEWTKYDRSQSGIDVGLSEFRIGLDFDYFVGGHVSKGFYIAAGLGWGHGTLDLKIPNVYRGDESAGAFYFTGGVGWMLTKNVGFEVKYYTVKYGFGLLKGQNGTVIYADEVQEAPAINYTLVVRF